MPKTSDYAKHTEQGGGATFDGHAGIVSHADGRLSELDPSVNLDGTVVDGYESQEREVDGSERDTATLVPDHEPVAQDSEQDQEELVSTLVPPADSEDAATSRRGSRSRTQK